MRKLLTLVLTAALVVMLLTGCNQAGPDTEPTAAAMLSEQPTTDRDGNPITPPPTAEGIIALSPAVTQTLIHLGLADQLVAIDTNSAILDGVPVDLPQVDLLSPDGELLLTLDANLVLCSSMTGYDGSEPLKPLSDSGICVAAIPSSASIDGIKEDIMFIADIVGQHDKGVAIVDELETGIQEVGDAVGSAEKKTVYFEIAAAPAAYSFGSNTFINEMIEIAGGENIFSDLDGWLAVAEEQVVARNPEVIFTNVNYIDDPVGEILSRASLANVAAVADGNVYYVDNYESSLANEYILFALREMAEAIHPDLWQND
jgi:iron complex transport system substrate-binding protein